MIAYTTHPTSFELCCHVHWATSCPWYNRNTWPFFCLSCSLCIQWCIPQQNIIPTFHFVPSLLVNPLPPVLSVNPTYGLYTQFLFPASPTSNVMIPFRHNDSFWRHLKRKQINILHHCCRSCIIHENTEPIWSLNLDFWKLTSGFFGIWVCC